MPSSSLTPKTPSRNLINRLGFSSGSSTKSKTGSRSGVSSSPSTPGTPTPNAIFTQLKRQQNKTEGQITTYFAGELLVIPYPLNPGGGRVKPSLVWLILKTYDMPQLFCFHEEKALTHRVERGLLYVARCPRNRGKCGYYVNFNLAYQNDNGPTRLYQPIQSEESDQNVTPQPVGTPKSREATSTAGVTPRSTQRSRKALNADRLGSSNLALTPTTSQESAPRDYSQPPYTQRDPRHPARDTYSIEEITLHLESTQGLDKVQFWYHFQECECCGNIARKDAHVCELWEGCFDDSGDIEIGNGYEADAESSPGRGGNTVSRKRMPSPLDDGDMGPPRKRVIIDLTVDDSD